MFVCQVNTYSNPFVTRCLSDTIFWDTPSSMKMISNSEIREGYLRIFIPLCAADLFLFFSVVMAMYTSYEYGHDAFWDIEFPNRSKTMSNESGQSICGTTNASVQGDQEEQIVQAVVSKWNLYISIAQGVPLIFSSLFFSSLSDFFGRRPFLLLGTLGVCIKYCLMTLAVIFQWNVYLFILFSFVDSLCGSWVTQLAIAMSILSDLTASGKSRSFFIAVFSFVFGLGFSLGSFLSGYMVTLLGYDYSMAIACGLSAIAFIITCFIPETLSNSQRKQNFSCMGNVKEIFRFYMKKDPTYAGFTRWKFITLILSFTLIMMSRLGSSAFETFYLLDSPFCFSPEKISIFETARTCISEIMILAFIKLMQRCLRDEVIAFLGSISSVALFIVFGIAPSTTFLYIGTWTFPSAT